MRGPMADASVRIPNRLALPKWEFLKRKGGNRGLLQLGAAFDIASVRSKPSRENQDEEDDQDDADDTNAAVAIAVAVAPEAATKAPEQEDDEDDNEYESERHDLSPTATPDRH